MYKYDVLPFIKSFATDSNHQPLNFIFMNPFAVFIVTFNNQIDTRMYEQQILIFILKLLF